MGEETVRVRVIGEYSISVKECIYPPRKEFDLEIREALRLEKKGRVRILEEKKRVPEGEKRTGNENREREILEAARESVAAGKVTGSGRPEVRAIEEILGYGVSGEERDRAWEILKEENSGTGNTQEE